MEKSIVLIKGGEILFHTNLGVAVDISHDVPLHKLMTKYGLMIPLETRAFTTARVLRWFIPQQESLSLDFVASIDHAQMKEKSTSLILTKTGEIFIVYRVDIKTGTFLTNNLYFDETMEYGIGLDNGSDDILKCALDTTDTLDEATDVVYKTYPFYFKNSLRIYKMDELFEWVKACSGENGVVPFTGSIRKPRCMNDVPIINDRPPIPYNEEQVNE